MAKTRLLGLALIALVIVIAAGEARADRIVLRGGGQIRGKVVPDPAEPDRVHVLTEKGKTPLRFQKAQVVEVIAETSVLDEYLPRREKAAPTAEAQHELGLWAEQQKLSDLAVLHYEAAVRLDKSFGPAHKKLGHVLEGGKWLTGDELREAQGLVRYKGRWITRDEHDRREERAALLAAQATWVKRVRVLRQAIAFGADTRRREAEDQLLEIRDPIAVAPLVHVLGNDSGPFRTMLDQVLGLIPGPESASALVLRVLDEVDPEVRFATLGELAARKEPLVVPQLVHALRSANTEVVNRAAWALGNLDAVATVPRLIPALLTTQYRVVMSPGAASSGGSLGSIPPAPGGASIGLGAGGSSGGAMPVSTSSGIRGSIPKIVPVTIQNFEVLAALVRLTGQDFGFDVASWRRWAVTSFQADANPIRRVPQP